MSIVAGLFAVTAWCAGAAALEPDAFDPPATPGCVLWLDGRDHAAISADRDGHVTQWRDKSGRGNHVAQAEAAERPIFVPTEGVSFSGSQWLVTESALRLNESGGNFAVTIIAVFTTAEEHPLRFMAVAGNGGAHPAGAGLALGFNDRHVITQNNAPALIVRAGERVLNLGGDATARAAGVNRSLFVRYPNLLTVTCGADGYAPTGMYVYGTQHLKEPLSFAVPSRDVWASPLAIGAADGKGAHPFAGTITELLVYDRVLTVAEREAIETELRAKYGLAAPSLIILDPRCSDIGLPSPVQAVAPDGTLLQVRDDAIYQSTDGVTLTKRFDCVRDPTLPNVAIGGGLLAATPRGTLIHVAQDRTQFVKLTYKDGKFTSDEAKSMVYALRSTDGGRTWTDGTLLQDGYCGAMRHILVTRKGSVVASLQEWDREHERHVTTIHVTEDDGLTYHKATIDNGIGRGLHDGFFESAVTELSDGRLWLLGRTSLGVLWQTYSGDGGRTWKPPTPTSISAGGYPAMLLRLRNGQHVLAWTRYYPDGYEGRDDLVNLASATWFWGEQVTSRFNRELSLAFSDDDGATWTEPIVIAEGRQDFAGITYPRMVELKPGEVGLWAGPLATRFRPADWMVRD